MTGIRAWSFLSAAHTKYISLPQVSAVAKNSVLRYLSPIGLGDEDDSLSVIFVEFIDSLLKKTLSHFALFKKGFLFQHVFYTQLIRSRYYQEIFRRTEAEV